MAAQGSPGAQPVALWPAKAAEAAEAPVQQAPAAAAGSSSADRLQLPLQPQLGAGSSQQGLHLLPTVAGIGLGGAQQEPPPTPQQSPPPNGAAAAAAAAVWRTTDGQVVPDARTAAAASPSTEGHVVPEAGGEAAPAAPLSSSALGSSQQLQPHCSHCGAQQAGPSAGSYWRRHGLTGARLCKRCWEYSRAYFGHLPDLAPAGAGAAAAQSADARARQAAALPGQESMQEEQAAATGSQPPPVKQEEGQAEGEEEEGPLRCGFCGTDSTTRWRRHPATQERLCNACRGFMDRHGGQLPELVPEAERQGKWRHLPAPHAPAARLAAEEATPPCTHCGAPCLGVKQWRHPDTGARLCGACRWHVGRKGSLPPLGSEGGSEGGSEEAAGQLHGQADEARRCLACGSTEHNGRSWHRHPLTKQPWFCEPCFGVERAKVKRQQRRSGRRRRRGDVGGKGEEEEEEEEEEADTSAAPHGHSAKRQRYGGARGAAPPAGAESGTAALAALGAVAAAAAEQQAASDRAARAAARAGGRADRRAADGDAAPAALPQAAASNSALAALAPRAVEWLEMYSQLDGLLERSGVGVEDAQDFKFQLLQLSELQQRVHFSEVQRQALGGRHELARRWVGRLLGRQPQGAAGALPQAAEEGQLQGAAEGQAKAAAEGTGGEA